MNYIIVHFSHHDLEDLARIIEESGAIGSLYAGWSIENQNVQIYIDPIDPDQLAQRYDDTQRQKLSEILDGEPAGSLAIRIGRKGKRSLGLIWVSHLLRKAPGAVDLPVADHFLSPEDLQHFMTASDTGQDIEIDDLYHEPDPTQGYSYTWPVTPFTQEFDAEEPPLETACLIALIGDCTVENRSFSSNNRPHTHLRFCLNRAFPDQPFVIRNYGAAGDTARWFLEDRTIEKITTELPHLHIAFVRYGINDRKDDGIDGCIDYLRQLCNQLKEKYPEVNIIIETSMWVDYPKHYMWDRNARLAPLYEAMKDFASRENYPALDIFRKMEEETKKGNWDLRIRVGILDETFDRFFEDDPLYFTDIHPNSKCMSLMAQWETDLIRQLYGVRLPHPATARK